MPFFKHLRLVLAGFAISVAAPAATLFAQTSEQASAPEYADLYEAMQQSVDEDVVMEGALSAMRREFSVDPAFSVMEAVSPGFIDEVTEGMRPILTAHSKRLQEVYAPRMVAVFAQHLTPEEASIAADFYRSDIGRRLMKTASSNYTLDATMSDLSADRDVTQAEVNQDLDSAVAATMNQLSPEDMAEIGRTFLANPALLKMNAVQGDIRALRLAMENEPLTPQAEREIDTMISTIFARRFPNG